MEYKRLDDFYLPVHKAYTVLDGIFLLRDGEQIVDIIGAGEFIHKASGQYSSNLAVHCIQSGTLTEAENPDAFSFRRQHEKLTLLTRALTTNKLDARILKLLQWFGKYFGEPVGDIHVTIPKLTQKEISEITNSCRPSVTRLVKQLEDKNLLRRCSKIISAVVREEYMSSSTIHAA